MSVWTIWAIPMAASRAWSKGNGADVKKKIRLQAKLGASLICLMGALPALAGPLDAKLVDAVRDNDQVAARKLLAAHANPNAPMPDKSTALAWAVDRQDRSLVSLRL